jgi:hypothetical protein
LKVRIRDPKCIKNKLAEKNEPNRYTKCGDDSDEALASLLFTRDIPGEADKYGDKSDWVDRHKDRDEGDKKFLDHRGRFPSAGVKDEHI